MVLPGRCIRKTCRKRMLDKTGAAQCKIMGCIKCYGECRWEMRNCLGWEAEGDDKRRKRSH